jgi:tetratricopeptide (TPR) repeat protein
MRSESTVVADKGKRPGGAGDGRSGGPRGRGASGSGRPGGRGPARGGGKPGGKPPHRQDGRSAASGRGASRAQRPTGDRRTGDKQERYDGPPIPEEVTGRDLAPDVRAQLRGLPEKAAARVAQHLAAAGHLVESDPELAYRHAKAARSSASRLAVVREALGETAYAAGHYSEALSELRAAKRMNGATAYLPIMADCHRALGNPQRALELAKSPSVVNFPAPAKAEMTIVEAGARRDLGQFDAALRTLELAPLNSKSRDAWVVRLRYAYADTLEQAGRAEDALRWFHRTEAIDGDQLTDAGERAAALERGSAG